MLRLLFGGTHLSPRIHCSPKRDDKRKSDNNERSSIQANMVGGSGALNHGEDEEELTPPAMGEEEHLVALAMGIPKHFVGQAKKIPVNSGQKNPTHDCPTGQVGPHFLAGLEPGQGLGRATYAFSV